MIYNIYKQWTSFIWLLETPVKVHTCKMSVVDIEFILIDICGYEQSVVQQVIWDQFCYMCQGLNSHYFHIIGDGKTNPIVGVYIPIFRIPY